MKELITRYIILDENNEVYGDFFCDGLAYEWMDSLEDEYPDKTFHIEPRIVEEI